MFVGAGVLAGHREKQGRRARNRKWVWTRGTGSEKEGAHFSPVLQELWFLFSVFVF